MSYRSLGAGVATELLAEGKGTDAGRQLSKPSPGPLERLGLGVLGSVVATGFRETVLAGLVKQLCLSLLREPEALLWCSCRHVLIPFDDEVGLRRAQGLSGAD